MTSIERENLIYSLIKKTLTSDQIDEELRQLDLVSSKLIGRRSEYAAACLLESVYWVSCVHPRRPEDDPLGIDMYVSLINHNRVASLPNILPVQIKSSKAGVDNFRNDPRYREYFGKQIFVLFARSTMSKTFFRKQFESELSRILRLTRYRDQALDTRISLHHHELV